MSRRWIYFLLRRDWGFSRRSGLSLVAALAVIGITLGVATLLLTQSALSGFSRSFRESILGFNAHLVVLFPQERAWSAGEEARFSERFAPELKASSDFLYRESLLVSEGRVKGAILKGMDPRRLSQVYSLQVRSFVPDVSDAAWEGLLGARPNAIVLGSDLAKDLAVTGLKKIKVFIPQSGKSIDSKNNFQEFQVVGIFTSGLYEFDHGFAFTEEKFLQETFSSPGAVTGREFRLKHPLQAQALAAEMQRYLGSAYEAVGWQQLNAPLFEAMKTERVLFFVVISLVILVASFNVVGVATLLVYFRRREIFILHAMGARLRDLRNLFQGKVLLIGLLGCLGGVVLGATVGLTLKHSSLFKLAKEVYFVEELPLDFSPAVLGWVLLTAFVILWLVVRLALHRVKNGVR